MATITIGGAGDHMIEIGGDVHGEFYCYGSCSRCEGVYDTGPGDRADACPDCGPVSWPLLVEHTDKEWEAATLPRADCPVCGRDVAVRFDDTVRAHRPPPDRPELAAPGGNCLGSYR